MQVSPGAGQYRGSFSGTGLGPLASRCPHGRPQGSLTPADVPDGTLLSAPLQRWPNGWWAQNPGSAGGRGRPVVGARSGHAVCSGEAGALAAIGPLCMVLGRGRRQVSASSVLFSPLYC